jgi:hypothetical protein
MKKEPEITSNLSIVVAIFLAIFFAIYYSNEPERIIKHSRDFPLDTINDKDTTYIIKTKIDSSYYDPQEHEPPERP